MPARKLHPIDSVAAADHLVRNILVLKKALRDDPLPALCRRARVARGPGSNLNTPHRLAADQRGQGVLCLLVALVAALGPLAAKRPDQRQSLKAVAGRATASRLRP
jgi:hypothetical protein